MIFTTTKKKQEKVELFPSLAVLTQFPYVKDSKFSKTVFKLNVKAMEDFGFPLSTPNASKIANGFDEENNIVLAAIDTNDIYTSNITAKNTFSSQKLIERIVAEFNIDTEQQHHFSLLVLESDGVKYSYLKLMDSTEKEEEPEPVAQEEIEEITSVIGVEIPEYNEVEDINKTVDGSVLGQKNVVSDIPQSIPSTIPGYPFGRVDTNNLF